MKLRRWRPSPKTPQMLAVNLGGAWLLRESSGADSVTSIGIRSSPQRGQSGSKRRIKIISLPRRRVHRAMIGTPVAALAVNDAAYAGMCHS
jgi:hypothetical protein